MLATMTCVSSSFAGLLNVTLTFPKISYNNAGVSALNYNASNQLFSISATPTFVTFANAESPKIISGTKSLQIRIMVDNTGALVGGVPGNDFSLSGTVTEGTNTYSGVLLTGEVTGFGFLESGGTDLYDLQFTPTGGALAGLICGDIGVQVTSGASTFNNDFTTNFNGQAKGTVGAMDHTPPAIICPNNITAECHYTNGLAGAYVSYPTPVVTDNCDPNPTIVCTPPSGSFFALPPPPADSSNYVVTCVVTDAAGNSNACTFTITVEDTLPPEFADANNPVISCSLCVPMILTNDPGACYATLTFPIPVAVDFCCPLLVSTTVSAVDENGAVINLTDLGNGMVQGQFPVGTNVNLVTTTANDGRGNSVQHLCAVVVMDSEPPVINCPTNQVVECTGGQIFFEEPVAVDNCPNATYSCTPTNGSVLGIGSHLIVCTVIDCSGNTNQCSFYVTVQDTTPPVISCPTNVTVECGQSTDPGSTGVATASDTCDSSPTVTFTDAVSGNYPQTITRTWTATDSSGNSNSCVQIITIQDTTPPVITCPPDKQLQCGDSTAPANTGTATAADSCSGNVAITFTDVATPANCTGNAGIDRTWKAADASGNSSTCVQHITFVDTTAPTITAVPAGSDLGCNPATLPTDASVEALVTATDNCGTPTVNVVYADVTTGCTVTRTFTVTATDACGNAATPQTVVYTWTADTTPPVISGVPTGSNLGCNPATLPTDASIKALVTATDNSGSATINVTHVDGGTAIAPTRTFTITATDGCGNVATASPVIYTWTADTTPPVISGVPTGSNLGCNPATLPTDASVKALVTATDNSGSATINVTHVDVNATNGCMVTRTFTVTATDGCGNTSAPQTVVYSWKSDTVAPILYGCTNQVVYEQVTVTTNRHCIPGGFNYYPICSNHWVWFNCVLTPCPGITNKTYTVCITGQTITGDIGGSNISLTVPDAQITYSSTCTNSTTTFSNNTWVTTCPLGSILTGDQFGSGLAYKMPFASGGGGNLTWSCNFSVPSSVPVNWKWGACVYTNLSNTYTNLGVKPVDDSTKCGYKNSDVACTPENYKQCLTPGARCGDFNHHCGNRTCPWVCNRGTNTVCSGGVVQYVPPTATDTCGGVPNIICSPLPGVVNFIAGSTNVTCTAVDDCGNVSSCTFTVTLLPPPPTITGPGNITTNTTSTSCSQVVKWTVTSSSPCGTPTTTCTPASGSTFPKGTTPVTCTAVVTSGNSNSNSCSFNVTVNDTTKPTITCPANITTNACSAVVTFAPTVTDNCPGVTYSCTPASGSVFAQGTNTVTCTATDTSGNTASASFKVIVTATAPGAPCSPKATAGTKQVVLTWTASSGTAPITYTVYRSTNLLGVGGYTSIASGITSLTYTNTGLTTGTTYYYYITATNCKGTSSNSSTVSAKSN